MCQILKCKVRIYETIEREKGNISEQWTRQDHFPISPQGTASKRKYEQIVSSQVKRHCEMSEIVTE